MNPTQWARITALFDDARQRPPGNRAAWLDDHCPDEATRAEVLAMLVAFDSDPTFMEQPPDLSAAVARAVSSGLSGTRLGAWRLVSEIGRGGMGVVYEVRRDDQEFERRAALKILPAASGAALVERFRFERRVLAGLDHPGIARLLDAGTTPDGLPYFVMEFIDGQRIDDWCQARGLSLVDRVALVERVADALSYAHQNLVIHRDVKPANILVTGDGQPKLLDFGIATILMAEGEQHGGLTRTGQHSFTPEFASPEQMRGDRVTTASDVYSLGVVLYQLLAGRPPYTLKGLSPLEAMKTVCDVDPPLMSAVARPEEQATLRGDLDVIVSKALAKAPKERYSTVAELTADLRAWREGRPVSASPQSFAYRTRRFIRRHRAAVAAGLAVTIAVLGGAIGTAWQARVAAEQRDKAEKRFNDIQTFSRSMIFDIFDAIDKVPGTTAARQLVLDKAVQMLDSLARDAGNDHELKFELAEGYRRLGVVQGSTSSENLGQPLAALASFEKAVQLADAAVAAAPEAERLQLAVLIRASLSSALHTSGDVAAGERVQREYVALVDELDRRYHDDPETLVYIANAYSNIGLRLAGINDFAGARGYYERAAHAYETLPPVQRSRADTVRAYTLLLKRLGAVEMVMGALPESEQHYRAALAIEEDWIRRNPDDRRAPFEMSYTLSDLGLSFRKREQNNEAMTYWNRALDLRRAAVAADPNNARAVQAVASTLHRIGVLLLDTGRAALAVPLLREELAIRQRQLAQSGRLPGIVFEEAWASVSLAAALQEAAEAGGADAGANHSAALGLFHTLRPADVKARADSAPDPEFQQKYDALAARLRAQASSSR